MSDLKINKGKRKQRIPLKGPKDVGVITRKAMSTNAYTMNQKDWEKKYPGFGYSQFYR